MLNIMQTKPLRNYGIDVTQTSFKPLMEELGLEKSVSELTQAEKEILRYISTLRQAKNAMGDFANTIESPANQLKVLKQQFYEMQAAIGNLFVGAFAKIIPYVNAIIMVIKEVAKTIAGLFNIKLKDYNKRVVSYAEDLNDYSEGLDGIADSAGGASDAIKELKRQTLGFDQINNLTSPTPNSSSGGSGGGAGGGILDDIDSKLLDALKGYENGMERVKMKATQIRDKIMEILGFSKHINEETGETYFTYNGWKATVNGLWKWFSELNPLAKIFVGIGVPATFLTLWRVLKKIGDATGVTTVLKSIFNISKKVLSPLKKLGTEMLSFTKTAFESGVNLKKLKEGLSTGIQSWREQEGIIKKGTNSLNGFKGVVQGTKNVLLGLGEAVVGIKVLDTSITDLKVNGANLENIIGTVGGTIATVFGGVQAGAVFGPWGAAIGGVVGALISLNEILTPIDVELHKSINEVNSATNENKKYFDSIKQNRLAIDEYTKQEVSVSKYHKNLLNELKDITDANGRVKSGYEDRAQFIVTTLSDAFNLEIDYQDGVIQNYNEIVKSADDAIQAEERYAKYKGLKEKFEDNQKNISDMVDKLKDQDKQYKTSFENLEKSVKSYNEWVEKGEKHPLSALLDAKFVKKDFDLATDSFNNAKETLKNSYSEMWQTMLSNNQYERAMVANTQGNYDELDKILNESKEERIAATVDSMVKQAKVVTEWTPEIIANWKTLSVASKDEYMKAIKDLPPETAAQIDIMTGNVKKITPEVVDVFAKLGEKSEDDLIEYLGLLPSDLQEEVIDKLKEKGAKIPDEIQKGIDEKPKPKAEITTSDKTEVQQKVNNATSGVTGSVNVGVNLPSSYAVSNALSGILSGVEGALNVSFKKNADGGIFANGRWQPIQAYANGGMPSGGQLFMAREAGPELVGRIGRHTAVMNNNQIVDSVKAGVYEAVSAAISNGGMGSVQIDLHTDEGVVVDRINKITRQTGTCPIDI